MGWMVRPFGIFRGTAAGPDCHRCPSIPLAGPAYAQAPRDVRTATHCKELASELARFWVRGVGRNSLKIPPAPPGVLGAKSRPGCGRNQGAWWMTVGFL